MKMLGLIGTILLALNAMAFPKASEEEEQRFQKLFREWLEDNSSRRVSWSSRMSDRLSSPAYKQLCDFGPEIIELLYNEMASGTVVRAVLEEKKYESLEVGMNWDFMVGKLWTSHTLCYTTKFIGVDSIWGDEPDDSIWEGGDVIANTRAAFLVKEMRIAKEEKRHIDARRAIGNLQRMGVFAFPVLFGELEQGHDDVVEVLAAEEWRSQDKPVLTKEGLLDWWKKNSKKYGLPPMSPKFRGTAQLEKWERIESPDRKIRVYDPLVDDPDGPKETNRVQRLTREDLLNFFGSISMTGTNVYLKCRPCRCIFNGIKYGNKWTRDGEVLALPEGSNLLLRAGDNTEVTFLPLVPKTTSERGFFVRLKTGGCWEGEPVLDKRGFLLFRPDKEADEENGKEGAAVKTSDARFTGGVVVPSLPRQPDSRK